MMRCLLVVTLAPLACGCAHTNPTAARPDRSETRTRSDVVRVLDELHDAASRAHGDRYFGLFSADAVFLGTDASERWTMQQFKSYALPLFVDGRGWTYTPSQRHVQVSPDGWAWFDELLNNARYGQCRGSGVLRQDASGGWKIVQYDLSVPIPNDMLPGVAQQVREFERREPKPEQAPPATR